MDSHLCMYVMVLMIYERFNESGSLVLFFSIRNRRFICSVISHVVHFSNRPSVASDLPTNIDEYHVNIIKAKSYDIYENRGNCA